MEKRNGLIVIGLLVVIFALLAVVVLPMSGSFNEGKEKAIAEFGCVKCHGENGISTKPDIPNLAGQSASYLMAQLNLFVQPRGQYDVNKARRHNQDMDKHAKILTPEAARIITDYYAKLPCPQGEGPKENELDLSHRFLKLCLECHDPSGTGFKKDMPLLYGQKRQYMLQTIHLLQKTPPVPTDINIPKERYNPTVKRLVSQLAPEKAGALVDYFASRTCKG